MLHFVKLPIKHEDITILIRIALFSLAAVLGTMMLAVAKDQTLAQPNRAAIIELDGAIGPATVEHMRRALSAVKEAGHHLIILKINTPGGLVDSTRKVNSLILNTDVPVIGYVAPKGAHAASAGTFILYATQIAAMAPGTNLGAASPLNWVREDSALKKRRKESTAEKKTVNDLVAYIRSLAELHGRNTDWAEKAVREAATLTAEGALKKDVINIIAKDIADLLIKLDGRSVEINGSSLKLETKNITSLEIQKDWHTKLLSIATNPNVALMIILIGFFGVLFEFLNPGLFGPGVIGSIFLVFGLYSMNLLPVNYTCAGLLILGLVFMTTEAFVPSFGILGIGGLVSFIIGAAFLIDTDISEFKLSWAIIIFSALLSCTLLSAVLGHVWRSSKRPALAGVSALIGKTAEVIEWADKTGSVKADGERWKAYGLHGLKKGQKVKIVQLDGLSVLVAQIENNES